MDIIVGDHLSLWKDVDLILKSLFQVPQGVPQMQQHPSGGQFQQQQLPQQPAVGVNPVPVNRGGGPPPQAQPVPIQQQQPRQGGVKP